MIRVVKPPLEQRTVGVCASQPGIVAVWLFGSAARGTAAADSVVDVGILFDHSPIPGLDGPRCSLEGAL